MEPTVPVVQVIITLTLMVATITPMTMDLATTTMALVDLPILHLQARLPAVVMEEEMEEEVEVSKAEGC